MADSYLCAFVKLVDVDSSNVIKKCNDSKTALQYLENLVRDIRAGKNKARLGFTVVDDSGTEPAGTITVTATNVTSGTDTITFDFQGGSVVLTAGTDFDVDTSSDNNQATLLAAGINENKFLNTLVTATVSTNVVTVTGKFPGPCLEGIDMATSDATAFALVQIGAGTAGVEGAAEYFFQGHKNSRDD